MSVMLTSLLMLSSSSFAVAGVTSALRQPRLALRKRCRLAGWFVLLAVAPTSMCERLAAKLVP